MSRDAFEKVPGCNGNGAAGTDYCFDPSKTDAPSEKPTPAPVTAKPTSQGLGDPTHNFMMRLYWSIDYFWQETKKEAWWCMECTKCDEYSLGDGPNHGCVTPGSRSSSCAPGHLIWIRKCTDTRRKFEWNIVSNPGSGDQIRADGTNLCFHTVDNRYLEIQPCDNTRSEQLFMPIADLDRFELRPYSQRRWSRNDAICLTQMHHPKEKELIGMQPCRRALGHETLYWEEFHR
ncbi:unnamed protein product [Cylindrotheca closterium]|uniref:Ricin B lectin domain-containing protein n=1 Tax=Cylindrotheca closterium TaxID=2856 RepID=A0AAD2CGE6_9STRA|nr:unnamed protein product [Cylindrotheca closterium]